MTATRLVYAVALVVALAIAVYNVPTSVGALDAVRPPAGRIVRPMLDQRWSLFAPDLSDTESSIYVRFDAQPVREVDLLASVREASRGRFLFPSRVERLLSHCALDLGNAVSLAQKTARSTAPKEELDRLRPLVELFRARTERRCIPFVQTFADRLGVGSLVAMRVVTRVAPGRVLPRLVCDARLPEWSALARQRPLAESPCVLA